MAYRDQPLPVIDGGTGANTLTGILVGSGTSVFTGVTITGTANQISVANGNGTGGNPTLSLTSTIYVSGISFDSGTDVLSAYASGTFTTSITGSTTNPTVTYSPQVGFYQKIGTKVTINCYVGVATISGGSGNTQIAGLPFTSNSTSNAASTTSMYVATITYGSGVTYYQGDIEPNSTLVLPIGMVSGSSAIQSVISGLSAGSEFRFAGDYNI